MPTSAHCHKRIAKVARECCRATYQELMSTSNQLYDAWKKSNPAIAHDPARLERAFVARKWGMFVEAARATMALALREPIDDKVKEEIVDILAKDSTLIRGRVKPSQIVGQLNNKQ